MATKTKTTMQIPKAPAGMPANDPKAQAAFAMRNPQEVGIWVPPQWRKAGAGGESPKAGGTGANERYAVLAHCHGKSIATAQAEWAQRRKAGQPGLQGSYNLRGEISYCLAHKPKHGSQLVYLIPLKQRVRKTKAKEAPKEEEAAQE